MFNSQYLVNSFYSNVEIVENQKSRYLVVKKDICKGETIFGENPIVSAQFLWNEFYNYTACEFCMTPLENIEENVRRLTNNDKYNIPYRDCYETNKQAITKCINCEIEYCSNECKLTAFNAYHEVLCIGKNRKNPEHPINILLDTWKQLHLPPEVTSITLILKTLAMLKMATDRNFLLNKLSNLIKNGISYKLLNERFFDQIEQLRNMTYSVFKKYLYVEECESWFSSEGFKQLFSLIGKNSQNISTSPLSVWVNKVSKLDLNSTEKEHLEKYIDKIYEDIDEISGSFINCEGTGLYELQSIINHSCAPNVNVTFNFNNNFLSIIAMKDIKAGEKIYNSFLDECDLQRSRHSRQKILKEYYLFSCECSKCSLEINEFDVTSEEDSDESDSDDMELMES